MVAALTFATSVITLAGGLEPAYEVAGDSIDDAVDDRVAAYRNARRHGGGRPSPGSPVT